MRNASLSPARFPCKRCIDLGAHARIDTVPGSILRDLALSVSIAAILGGGKMLFRHSKTVGALAATGFAVSACASVIEGRSQQISINTNPPGAECGLYREQGIRIAAIQSTPGTALVEKTKNDIYVVCVKRGYQQAILQDHSGVAGSAFVNIIGGVFTLGISTVIGVAVDSSNGSDNKYESPLSISMIPNAPGQPEGPAALPKAFDAQHPEQADAQQAAPARDETSPAEGDGAAAARASVPAPPALSTTSSVASASFAAGIWVCAINNIGSKTNPRFTLQFVVSGDKSILVTNYDNAPATIIQSNPLTFTAINPRGSRLTKFTWKSDNSMIITGPNSNKQGTFFYNEGTCVKT
jgi:hypothetical protein